MYLCFDELAPPLGLGEFTQEEIHLGLVWKVRAAALGCLFPVRTAWHLQLPCPASLLLLCPLLCTSGV